MINLVVFSGWPSSGKTTIAKGLESRKTGYVSTDETRDRIYPGMFPLDIKYPSGWEAIWKSVCDQRDAHIMAGNNVVIDSCGQNSYIRGKFLYVLAERPYVRKTVVFLDTDEEELVHRERQRGRDIAAIKRIKDAMLTDWETPSQEEFSDAGLVVYRKLDPVAIISDLMARLFDE